MNIIYTSNLKIPSRSANTIQIIKTCEAMSENGHDVLLFAPDQNNRVSFDQLKEDYGVQADFNVRYIKFPALPEFMDIQVGKLLYMTRLRRELKQFSADLIYSRSAFASVFAPRIATNHFLELHKAFPNSSFGLLQKQLFLQLLRSEKLDRIVCISDALREHMEREYELTSMTETVRDAAEVDETLVAQSYRNGSRLQVGYGGHLYPGKGMEMIQPLAEISDEYDFHVFGGTEEDLEYWKSRDLSDNLQLHGFVPHATLLEELSRMDVLIAPYQSEVAGGGRGVNLSKWMSPLKLFEYMGLGKPIICSDLPVLREFLTHRENALLVSPSNVEAWSNALKSLKQDKRLRKKLGRAARNDFVSKYTWKKRAETILNLI